MGRKEYGQGCTGEELTVGSEAIKNRGEGEVIENIRPAFRGIRLSRLCLLTGSFLLFAVCLTMLFREIGGGTGARSNGAEAMENLFYNNSGSNSGADLRTILMLLGGTAAGAVLAGISLLLFRKSGGLDGCFLVSLRKLPELTDTERLTVKNNFPLEKQRKAAFIEACEKEMDRYRLKGLGGALLLAVGWILASVLQETGNAIFLLGILFVITGALSLWDWGSNSRSLASVFIFRKLRKKSLYEKRILEEGILWQIKEAEKTEKRLEMRRKREETERDGLQSGRSAEIREHFKKNAAGPEKTEPEEIDRELRELLLERQKNGNGDRDPENEEQPTDGKSETDEPFKDAEPETDEPFKDAEPEKNDSRDGEQEEWE